MRRCDLHEINSCGYCHRELVRHDIPHQLDGPRVTSESQLAGQTKHTAIGESVDLEAHNGAIEKPIQLIKISDCVHGYEAALGFG